MAGLSMESELTDVEELIVEKSITVSDEDKTIVSASADVTTQGVNVDNRRCKALIEKSTFSGANISPNIEKQQNVSYKDCTVHNYYHHSQSSYQAQHPVEGMKWLLPGKFGMFNKQPLHSTAKVYLGKHFFHDLSREVAVKLVEHRPGRGREVSVLMKLQHPNIVQVIDFGEFEGLGHWIYIILELCSQNLHDYVMSRCSEPLDYPQCISFSKQIIEGVVYLHGMKIIHRDLKPANVLISRCGKYAKVSDFGISKVLPEGQEEATNTSPEVGTEGYMAPELLVIKGKVSFAIDVFSFGILISFILSQGLHPFGSNRHIRAANIIQNQPPDLRIFSKCLPRSRTEALFDLLRQTLRHNPRERLSSQEVLKHSFFSDISKSCVAGGKAFSELQGRMTTLQIQDDLNNALEEAIQELFTRRNAFPMAIKKVNELIVKSPDAILQKGDEYRSKNMHLQALILYQVSRNALEPPTTNTDREAVLLKKLCTCIYHAISSLSGLQNRSWGVITQFGLELLGDLLIYLRVAVNITPEAKALTQARCLNYMAHVCSLADDRKTGIQYIEDGISILAKQFGARSNKLKRYGWLLWNLGDEYHAIGRYFKAEFYYLESITAFRDAPYFDNELDKRKHIDMVQERLDMVRSKQVVRVNT